MSYQEYFNDGDKPYSENLNDALLLLDAFDVTVPVSMPDMFANGEFSSAVNVARKCGVGVVTLKSVASGVTVGTSSISGSGEVVFRVYPNFNAFYKWSKIILEKTGTVSIAFKKADGTSISATVGSDGTISEASALKELQEIDVVLTLTSATISSILIEFINNQTDHIRVNALLEADQLVNVDGTIADDDLRAVNGDTVNTAIDSLDSSLSADIALKENLSNKVTSLDTNSDHYPTCPAVNTGLALKEDISNKVTTLDSSDTHYPSSKAVKTVTDSKEDKSNKVHILDNSITNYPSTSAVLDALYLKADKAWTKITTTVGDLYVNASLRLAEFSFNSIVSLSSANEWVIYQSGVIPSGYRPKQDLLHIDFDGAEFTDKVIGFKIKTNGDIAVYCTDYDFNKPIYFIWRY